MVVRCIWYGTVGIIGTSVSCSVVWHATEETPLGFAIFRWALVVAAIVMLTSMGVPAASPAGQGNDEGRLQPLAPSADDRYVSLPPGCLVAGRIDDLPALSVATGKLLQYVDERADAAYLLSRAGNVVASPDLTGINLAAPVHFYYMNPKLYPAPWVFQFELKDQSAFLFSLAARGVVVGEQGRGVFRLHGLPGRGRDDNTAEMCIRENRVTWYGTPEAGAVVLRWAGESGRAPDFTTSGQVRLLVDVPQCLETYRSELDKQVNLMKTRMREAVERRGDYAGREAEIAATQGQLDTVRTLLEQVGRCEVAIGMRGDGLRIAVVGTPRPHTTLAGIVRSHPPASLEVLRSCPQDALVVVFHNLSIVQTLRRKLAGFLGHAGARALAWMTPDSPGATLIALFLVNAPVEGDGAGRWLAEILELRDGARASDAAKRWHGWTETNSGGGEWPFTLRLRSVPEVLPRPGGVGNHEERLWLADVSLKESQLGSDGCRVVERIFGKNLQVAQWLSPHRSIFVLGGSPLQRLQQIGGLSASGGASLATAEEFRRTVAEMPHPPNLLIFVAPEGVRRWLVLGGLPDHVPILAEDTGLAFALKLSSEQGVATCLHLPVGILERALAAQNKR